GAPVAPEVNEPNIVASLRNKLHPGEPIERQVEGSLSRISRSMDIKDCLLRGKFPLIHAMLVAEIEVQSWHLADDHLLVRDEDHWRGLARGLKLCLRGAGSPGSE